MMHPGNHGRGLTGTGYGTDSDMSLLVEDYLLLFPGKLHGGDDNRQLSSLQEDNSRELKLWLHFSPSHATVDR